MADAPSTPQRTPTAAAASPAGGGPTTAVSDPAAPLRPTGKRRAGSISADPTAAVAGSAVKPRVTRRELKKLTEIDVEEKEELPIDIISKERKEIRWRGLPTNLQHDAEMLIAERNERVKSVEQKKQHLQDLLVQQVAMKNLLKRNAKRRKESTSDALRDEGRIFLPFIVVNTSKDTVIQCEMSEDRQDIFFNFSNPFEINDDTEILRRLELHKCSPDELKHIVPEKLLSHVPAECESKSEEN
ncbi:hypothetical protein P43SY_002698 [Pythium insidiosum]|uniref:Transcription factor DP C-terminal domain-containing protein n=1 Tax=Pythium insidiosum TaxID=114742 RepID=A0AAD5QBA5_PYTIN|nr:hypothetical protein P43SY_002698 [Pythium insidiosum]